MKSLQGELVSELAKPEDVPYVVEIEKNTRTSVRKATPGDAHAIVKLIEQYFFKEDGSGFLIALDEGVVRAVIKDSGFFVAYAGNQLVGCASINRHNGIAELRSLAVHPEYQSKGIGSALMKECISEASKTHNELYALTKSPEYFETHGFVYTTMPQAKLLRDCAFCPQYNNGCKEDAIVLRLH